MMHAEAAHPNCAYMWIEHSLSPKVQGDLAAWFGSFPSVPAACKGNALLTDDGLQDQRLRRTSRRLGSGGRRSPNAPAQGGRCVPYLSLGARTTSASSADGTGASNLAGGRVVPRLLAPPGAATGSLLAISRLRLAGGGTSLHARIGVEGAIQCCPRHPMTTSRLRSSDVSRHFGSRARRRRRRPRHRARASSSPCSARRARARPPASG